MIAVLVLHFYLVSVSFTFLLLLFILLTKKSKIKTSLTDSQPGYILSMFLKFWLISA